MMATVTFPDTRSAGTGEEVAAFIAQNLTGATAEGSTVVLTADALTELAERPDDCDGHYDGRHIWVGGSEYEVKGEPMAHTRWVNLTPHPVKVYDGDTLIMHVDASGVSARIAEQVTATEPIRSAWSDDPTPPMSVVTLGAVEGLPPAMPDTVYIVSMPLLMGMVAAGVDRPDCVYPYPQVRDSAGRIIGCGGFARISA